MIKVDTNTEVRQEGADSEVELARTISKVGKSEELFYLLCTVIPWLTSGTLVETR